MAPIALQTKRSTITSAGTSISATFDSTPTAGNLLLATLGIDKSAGGINAPSGWTLLGSPYIDSSVSGAVAYRIATGSESSSVQWSWTTSTRAAMTLTETNLTGASVMGTVQRTAVSGSGVTSVSLTGSSSTGQGVSFGVASVDSGLGGAWQSGEPSWSSGYTVVVNEPGDAFAGETSNGGACSAVAWKPLSNGTSTGFTASWTGTDQAFGYLVNFAYTGESGSTPPAAIASLWVDGVTSTTAKFKVKATSGDPVTVRRSTSSSMAGATTSGTVVADGTGMAEITLTGLASGTTYHYRVAIDGVDATNGAGSFRTAPVGSASFSFAYASCRSHATATQTVFDRIRTRSPLFFLLTGDKGYEDVNSTSAGAYRPTYDDFTQQSNVAALLRVCWMPYVWSDHDFCGNGSHAGSTGAATAQTVFRERVPAHTLPSATGIYRTFVVGRVRFIVLDTRSHRTIPSATDNSSKVMLGAAQEQWLYDTLESAAEALIFIVSAEPWIGGGNQDDHWGSYQTEQNRIVGNVPAATWRKVVWLCGDAHMLAFDDGTNSPGGSPVWQAAALDRTGSTKGGPYSGGTLSGTGQFGWVSIVDNGGTDITATWSGIRSNDTTWASTTWEPSSTVGNFTLWDGSAEVPLVHEGVWDGSAVVPSASVEVV